MAVDEEVQEDFEGEMQWDFALDQRASVPDAVVVYVLWLDEAIPRLLGRSNILYIGSTIRLGGDRDDCRLYPYRYSSQTQPRLIRESVASLAERGKRVMLRWKEVISEEEAKILENHLLEEYRIEHLEYPPFNGRAVSSSLPGP